jgi:chemotaxis-related protein WspD
MNDPIEQNVIRLEDCWNRIGVWSHEKPSCPELEHAIHCRNCRHYSAAGRQMLERPVPDQYRRDWTERFAKDEEKRATRTRSALLFRLGDEWLGISSRFVSEITQMRTVHSLPHKSGTLVKGLVNIRGELKICVSIGQLLGLEKAREAHCSDHEIHERMILIEKDGESFVFPVSEVHGIHRFTETAVQAAPATLAKSKHGFSAGVLHWNDYHVGVLDHELVFYALRTGLS